MKYTYLILLVFFGIAIFTSCEKENIDIPKMEIEEVVPEVVTCDLSVEIIEEPEGILTANVSAGTAPFTFIWSTGESTNTISVDSSNNYFVTVTDAEGCMAEKEIEVLILNCADLMADASLEILEGESISILDDFSLTGLIPPFTYQWSTGETGPEITPFESGPYSVTVTSAKGCKIIIGIDLTIITCDNFLLELDESSSGIVVAAVFGGTPPYTYEWSNGLTSSTISNLESGTYTVTATDTNGCVLIESIDIEVPCNDLVVSLAPNIQPNTLSVIANGGSGNYEYQWSDGMQGNPIANIVSGLYTVTVTDLDSGCTETLSMAYYESENCSEFAIKIVETSPGTLELTACGGEPPYSYLWNSGQTGEVLTNLASGNYVITITDSNGCIVAANYIVDLQEECDDFMTQIVESSPGTLITDTSGGLPPLSFLWSTNETTPVINVTQAGLYSVTVTDANECITTGAIQL